MSPAELLAELRAQGVRIRADGPDLELEAGTQPSQELLDAVRAHKRELLELLRYPILLSREVHEDGRIVESWKPSATENPVRFVTWVRTH